MKDIKRKVLVMICFMAICLLVDTDISKANTTSTEIAGASVFQDHLYKAFDDAKSWKEAEAYCESLGGHLATISSAEENDYIVSLIKERKKNYYWIGIRLGSSGNYEWVDNSSVLYEKWYEGEPDNYQGLQGYGFILSKDYDSSVPSGYWGDLQENGDSLDNVSFWGLANAGFVCEWDYKFSTVKTVENDIQTKTDGDLSASEYELLQAKIIKTTASTLKLKWKKIRSADGYIIYGNIDGKNKEYKKLLTINNSGITSYTMNKLKKGTYYKYFVVAYKNVRDSKSALTVSKTIHACTTGGKYSNAKSVKITKIGSSKSTSKITLNVGKTATIQAESVKKDKKIEPHRGLAYESTNKAVASVSKKGIIKAKTKGFCKIYVYAQNGVSKEITVTVK